MHSKTVELTNMIKNASHTSPFKQYKTHQTLPSYDGTFLMTGTLKRRRAQQHANSQVQSQTPHSGHGAHAGHGAQRQQQRQPQRQAQQQRHHRQPRENYQMGQMRRWDPRVLPPTPPMPWLLLVPTVGNKSVTPSKEKSDTVVSHHILHQ